MIAGEMSRIKVAPKMEELSAQMHAEGWDMMACIGAARAEAKRVDRYLSWNELRFRRPPEGMSEKQWWLGLKLHRMSGREYLDLLDHQEQAFSYSVNQYTLKLLHEIDILGATNKPTAELERSGSSYLLNRLEEESITSSMLEGAITTRAQAKAMLRQQRKPLGASELMVVNNFTTMQEIGRIKDEDFSVEQILALHRMITKDTLDDASMEGQFRQASDEVRVEDSRTGDVVHMPPAAEDLQNRLQKLCDFANQGDEDYTHPVIRASIIHFWLAYDHPFVDGNGRTARALFYWYMLKSGYSQYEYISISSEILKHPKRYYQSFVDTEEDDLDLNYFIFNQLRTIKSAIESLGQYIATKSQEHENKLEELSSLRELNIRQKAIYAEILKKPEMEMGVSYVARQYQSARQTARTDLQLLEALGLVTVEKRGKSFIYRLAAGLRRRGDN